MMILTRYYYNDWNQVLKVFCYKKKDIKSLRRIQKMILMMTLMMVMIAIMTIKVYMRFMMLTK